MFLVVKKKSLTIYLSILLFIAVLIGLLCLGGINEMQVNSTTDYNEIYNDELLPGEAVEVSKTEDELLIARNNREYTRSKTSEEL